MGRRGKVDRGRKTAVRQFQVLLLQLDGSGIFGFAEGFFAVEALLLFAGLRLDLLHLLLDYLQLSGDVASAYH